MQVGTSQDVRNPRDFGGNRRKQPDVGWRAGRACCLQLTVVSRLGRTPAEPVAVLSTSAAVRSAVAEGIGPAVISGLAVADDVRLGRLVEVPLRGEAVRRPITALWRGTARDLAAVSRELLEEAIG